MRGRNILITGGTSGMGKATASQLAKMGTQLLLIGRNRDKGEAAVIDIKHASGSETVIFFQADLSLLREMRRTAGYIRQAFDQLDVLVHGAGGTFPQQRVLTDEGLEMSFAVDFLVRHVLTNELLDLLHAAPAPQVLSIAGGGAEYKAVDFENLNGEKSYSWSEAVAQASATNDLLTMEQINRYQDITFYNYGPGLVRTATIMGTLLGRVFFNTIGRLFSRSAEQAANDIVALLTGDYPSGFYGRSLKRNEPSAAKSDAARLWSYSEQLFGNLST
ncbi:MAG: SDR family NAD(P)-dependent oxidoreductase [Anaerolineales bacterium]|nr:SDR family NAD(P)-dependent oxidoreductase [Anaerolineales bacterium]